MKNKQLKGIYSIQKKIQYFDISALLDYLSNHGYKFEDLIFEGNFSLSSSNQICEQVNLTKQYPNKLVIKLNLGLLTSCSPLPTFFHKLIEEEDINASGFIRYIQYFNHHLIKDFIKMTHPENFFFDNWHETSSQYLKILAFNCLTSLTWLLKLCFPEFTLQTSSLEKLQKNEENPLFLGQKLGQTSHIHKKYQSFYFFVFVLKEDTLFIPESWGEEINARIHQYIRKRIASTILLTFKSNHITSNFYLSVNSSLGFHSLGSNHDSFCLNFWLKP